MTNSAPSKLTPLAGIRVLDLTRVLAGPYCTMLLADLGAEVVKIERPDGGDDARQFGPFMPSGESAYFASVNRGKKSITLDLKQESDVALFRQLVARCDVLVENYRPGTMEQFGRTGPHGDPQGLGSAALRALNPRLIYASATGFGRTGPDAGRAAYDVIVQARSGLMSLTGHTADEPTRVGSSISDILAGLFTTVGITSALRQREITGVGCDLDLAMLDCSVAVLENAVVRYALSGVVPGPIGTRHPSISPFQAYRTADAPIVIAAGNEALWRKLCDVLEAPELLTDSRFLTNRDRALHVLELEPELNRRLSARPSQEWLRALEQAGVPAAPIQNMAEVTDDPQLVARQMWHTLTDTDGQNVRTASTPFQIDGQKPHLSPTWPRLGEHTQEILTRWEVGVP